MSPSGRNKGHGTFNNTANPKTEARPPGKREAPFSLRLSAEEKARLKVAAGNMALAAYIKARLFEDLPAVPRQRAPTHFDKALLGQLLSALGRSRLSSNLNQIAHAAHIGTLPVDDDLSATLKAACADISTMRSALLNALGQRKPATRPAS